MCALPENLVEPERALKICVVAMVVMGLGTGAIKVSFGNGAGVKEKMEGGADGVLVSAADAGEYLSVSGGAGYAEGVED